MANLVQRWTTLGFTEYEAKAYVALLQLEAALRPHDAIPVAVGSGTVNDLTKLASHRTGRPYLCVATAASMDGYTAFGASITCQGNKHHFPCPAPAAVVADLDLLSAAPGSMNAWGYADLMAKVPAGADWMVADAVGAEPGEILIAFGPVAPADAANLSTTGDLTEAAVAELIEDGEVQRHRAHEGGETADRQFGHGASSPFARARRASRTR